jgi:hypothetical protein
VKGSSVALLAALVIASVGSGGSSCSYRRLGGLDGGGGHEGGTDEQDGGDEPVLEDAAGLGDVPNRGGDTSADVAACVPSSRGRDCNSQLDNDCDGRPDNTLDQQCTCVPGSVRNCNAHPGKDGFGTCRAGTQLCALGEPPTTSAYASCSGDVGPATDDCNADGADKDCNGIKGDGDSCTHSVYFYTKGGDVCDLVESAWPEDIFMIDADDPVGVPNGYVLTGQFKMFRQGGGGKRAFRRCFDAVSGQHFSGNTCNGFGEERLLGYASTIDGGNGWVQLMDVGGRNGILGQLRSDDPKCCPYNCLPTRNFVLK